MIRKKVAGNIKKNDINIHMPVSVIPSLHKALQALVQESEELQKAEVPDSPKKLSIYIGGLERTNDGVYVLSKLAKGKYPDTIYKLCGGYVMKVSFIYIYIYRA